jgi:hypothetical protein
MLTSSYCILVILVFFALVLHALHLEEKRTADRRRQDLPHGEERRKQDRRRPQSRLTRIGWAIRSQWMRGFGRH